jgi:glucosamine kinase
MTPRLLLLGVDGGGTRCRGRLMDASGSLLGEGNAGPANLRLGLDECLRQVQHCTARCLDHAGIPGQEGRIVACLALAGASEPTHLELAKSRRLPFRRAVFATDAHAACVGAHKGRDGAIVIAGTGSIGWALLGGRTYRVGGWGFPLSDEGSGAWIGRETLRRVLSAQDGLTDWSGLLKSVFQSFDSDAHKITHWAETARPRDYAALAPTVFEHAGQGDVEACRLIGRAAKHIEALISRLKTLGTSRISLMGGLAGKLEPFLSDQLRSSLVAPSGDALSGALRLARAEADRLGIVRPEKALHG